MKKIILSIVAVSALMFTSCSDDNNTPPTPPKSKELIELEGLTTGGKSAKVDVVKKAEVLDYQFIKDAKLETTVAKSSEKDLTDWKAEETKIKNITTKAVKGKSGSLKKGDEPIYLNEKGVEIPQLIAKGVIGAFQLANFNNAMMEGLEAKTEAERTKAIKKAEKFLVGNASTLIRKDGYEKVKNSFGKYMVKTKNGEATYALIKEVKANVKDAEKYGVSFIKLKNIANKVVALRAVRYLVVYSDKIIKDTEGKDLVKNIHELSEGLGFAYSLQFAYKGEGEFYLTAEEAKEIVTANLWEEADLNKLKAKGEEIAKKFGEGFLVEAKK